MNVLITGASSGIGEALALEWAAHGAEKLFLCGRDAGRLAAVAANCRARGAEVHERIVDVADAAAVRAWMLDCEAKGPLEIVCSNAGVSTGAETEENARRTFAVNVDGGVNVVLTALGILRTAGVTRRRRQIAITASIAGYAPLASCPSYAASKAALKSWGLSLRGMLRREGIWVNVVCPGFVRSRITARNTCPMPFFMEADRAAKTIISRLDRNCGLVAFPWPMRLAVWLLSALPWRLAEAVMRLLPEKCAAPGRAGRGR